MGSRFGSRFGSGLDPDLDPDLDPNQASTRRALREGSIKFHFPTLTGILLDNIQDTAATVQWKNKNYSLLFQHTGPSVTRTMRS
jgi:hypothetical protein